ncbi:MAG: septum formation initiator family protein [Candidatus Brocadia sp.]|nr:septum formation initiator family protein [Candidatus Brocadia sp.]
MQDVKIGIPDGEHDSTPDFLPSASASHPGEKNGGADRNPYFRKFVLMVFITSSVVIFFSWTISKTRLERVRMLEVKKVLEKQATRLEAENLRLENEYSALKKDPVRIEKEAREFLGFTGPDEVIYEKHRFRIKSTAQKEPEITPLRNRWKVFLFDGAFPWQFPAFVILIAASYYLLSYHYEYRKLRKSNC